MVTQEDLVLIKIFGLKIKNCVKNLYKLKYDLVLPVQFLAVVNEGRTRTGMRPAKVF